METQAAVAHVLPPLLAECNIESRHVAVRGNAGGLAKKWAVSFRADGGTADLAAARVDRVFAAMRHADGSFRDLTVETPSKVHAKVCINRDQNPKQQATERATRKLRDAVKQTLGSDKGDININKHEGIVSIAWKPIIKVEAPRKGNYVLRWHEAMASVGVSEELKNQISAAFHSSAGSVPDEQWTILARRSASCLSPTCACSGKPSCLGIRRRSAKSTGMLAFESRVSSAALPSQITSSACKRRMVTEMK